MYLSFDSQNTNLDTIIFVVMGSFDTFILIMITSSGKFYIYINIQTKITTHTKEILIYSKMWLFP